MTGVDSTQSANQLREMCARDSGCQSQSILPIVNKTGNSARCVSSSLGNTKLLFNNPRLYFMYDFKNGCPHSVSVHVKIDNRWSEYVGNISQGASSTVSLMYNGAAAGSEPAVIMFCKGSSSPRDDLTCTGD
jgi:hypothetical protein